MTSFRLAIGTLVVASAVLGPVRATAQDIPAEYKGVLTTLGKTGDFKDGVLKVNIPRNDLRVTIDKRCRHRRRLASVAGWPSRRAGHGRHDGRSRPHRG